MHRLDGSVVVQRILAEFAPDAALLETYVQVEVESVERSKEGEGKDAPPKGTFAWS
jgi:hypothetical protein